jgi:hypothetical protein
VHRELEIGNLLVQELTCLLCFLDLSLIFFILVDLDLSLEFAIELRGKLLIDVTVCLTFVTIFITFIAVGPLTRYPSMTGLGMASGGLRL